jgi:hypothetical protein
MSLACDASHAKSGLVSLPLAERATHPLEALG